MFKTALRIGVPIAFGTDAGVFPHGMNAMEFALMTDQGMAPAAALLAGTRDAAKLLGVEAEVGTLEAGKVGRHRGGPRQRAQRHPRHRAPGVRHAPGPDRGAEGGQLENAII